MTSIYRRNANLGIPYQIHFSFNHGTADIGNLFAIHYIPERLPNFPSMQGIGNVVTRSEVKEIISNLSEYLGDEHLP